MELPNFKELCNSVCQSACVVSIEKLKDGAGEIRIVDGNDAYLASFSGEMYSAHVFVPNRVYTEYLPKNLNFEDFCYRSAVLHQQLHSYVDLFQMGLWLEMYLLPLESDQEGIGYCLYSYNVAPKADTGTMSDVDPEVSSAVLASCIKLHGTEDFEVCIQGVTDDILGICGARRCCLLIVDEEARDCHLLADSKVEGYVATRLGESMNKSFYPTVESWKETIGGSTCLIIKNEQDMEVIKERNPLWYESLKKATVETLMLFPLKYNGKLVGYVWSSNFDIENTVKIKGVLELATFFIASRIANYQLVKRLGGGVVVALGHGFPQALNSRVAGAAIVGGVALLAVPAFYPYGHVEHGCAG